METNKIPTWINKAYMRSVKLRTDTIGLPKDKVEDELNSIKAFISNIMDHEGYKEYDFSQHQSQFNGISENLTAVEKNLRSENQSWWKRLLSNILDAIGIFLGFNSLGQKLLGTGSE